MSPPHPPETPLSSLLHRVRIPPRRQIHRHHRRIKPLHHLPQQAASPRSGGLNPVPTTASINNSASASVAAQTLNQPRPRPRPQSQPEPPSQPPQRPRRLALHLVLPPQQNHPHLPSRHAPAPVPQPTHPHRYSLSRKTQSTRSPPDTAADRTPPPPAPPPPSTSPAGPQTPPPSAGPPPPSPLTSKSSLFPSTRIRGPSQTTELPCRATLKAQSIVTPACRPLKGICGCLRLSAKIGLVSASLEERSQLLSSRSLLTAAQSAIARNTSSSAENSSCPTAPGKTPRSTRPPSVQTSAVRLQGKIP